MPLTFLPPPDRKNHAYRSWRAEVLRERPVCEHCNSAASARIAHLLQPVLGGGLMDKSNVLALCIPCDRDFTRSTPPLRRRKQKRNV